MRRGGGKLKGASFERQCCRLLSLWVSFGFRDDCFWRSAMSGGRATIFQKKMKGRKGHAQAGDVSAVHPEGAWLVDHFYIECKFYRDLDIMTGIFKHRGKFMKFWKETKRHARSNKRLPMLIMKQNGIEPLVCFGNTNVTDRIRCDPILFLPRANMVIYWLNDLLKEHYGEFSSDG